MGRLESNENNDEHENNDKMQMWTRMGKYQQDKKKNTNESMEEMEGIKIIIRRQRKLENKCQTYIYVNTK